MSAQSHRTSRIAFAALAAAFAIAALPAVASAQPESGHGVPAVSSIGPGTVAAQQRHVATPPINAVGTDVAAQDQQAEAPASHPAVLAAPHEQVQSPVSNATGTDVAAHDQQAPRAVVNTLGTNVAAHDQQASIAEDPAPVSPATPSNDSFPTLLVLALAALGLTLGGVALASKGAVTRRRTRAAA